MLCRLLMLVAVITAAHFAHAQVIQQQTVQLPTFHYFGVQTTVVVPDRGSIVLGGVSRSTMGRTRFDKVGNSYSRVRDSVGFTLGATVIDNAEIERHLLAEAARRRGAKFDVLGRAVDSKPSADRQALRPAPIVDRSRDKVGAEVYLRRGRDAELARQPEVAKVFYRRAAKLGNAVERRAAEERLAALDREAQK